MPLLPRWGGGSPCLFSLSLPQQAEPPISNLKPRRQALVIGRFVQILTCRTPLNVYEIIIGQHRELYFMSTLRLELRTSKFLWIYSALLNLRLHALVSRSNGCIIMCTYQRTRRITWRFRFQVPAVWTMCRWVFSDGWVVYKFSWCGIYSSPQPPALPLTCGNHFHSQSSQKIALRLLIGNIWECRLWELQTFSWNSPQFFFQNLRISAQLCFWCDQHSTYESICCNEKWRFWPLL